MSSDLDLTSGIGAGESDRERLVELESDLKYKFDILAEYDGARSKCSDSPESRKAKYTSRRCSTLSVTVDWTLGQMKWQARFWLRAELHETAFRFRQPLPKSASLDLQLPFTCTSTCDFYLLCTVLYACRYGNLDELKHS